MISTLTTKWGAGRLSHRFEGRAKRHKPFESREKCLNKGFTGDQSGDESAMGVTYKAFDVDLRCPVTLKVISEKYLGDPAQRFRTPNELLKVIPTITGAIDVGRRIARKNLKQIPHRTSHTGTAKPPARLAPNKISLARLPVTGSEIFGQEEDLTFLDLAWVKKEVNVVTFTAFRE